MNQYVFRSYCSFVGPMYFIKILWWFPQLQILKTKVNFMQSHPQRHEKLVSLLKYLISRAELVTKHLLKTSLNFNLDAPESLLCSDNLFIFVPACLYNFYKPNGIFSNLFPFGACVPSRFDSIRNKIQSVGNYPFLMSTSMPFIPEREPKAWTGVSSPLLMLTELILNVCLCK